MKFFLNLTLVFLFISALKAEKYIYESSSSVISDHIKISKDLTSTTVNIESRWTDSYGEYGMNKCNGHKLAEKEKISLNVFCENTASNGDKFWTQLLRDKDMQAGIGRYKIS